MPTVRFTGRVLPAALGVSIPSRPTFHWRDDALELEMTFRVQVQDNVIAIDCDFSTIYADKPDGILGQDFFTEFRTVLIDFSKNRLVLE